MYLTVQPKLIKSIVSTLTYEARLEELDLYSLICRRQRGDLIELYKTLNSLLNSFYRIDPKDIFTLQLDSATRGHQMKLFKPRMSRSIGQHFLSFRVIQQWNGLPQEVVMAKTISSFKYLLDEYWKETGHGHCQRPSAYYLILYFLLSII